MLKRSHNVEDGPTYSVAGRARKGYPAGMPEAVMTYSTIVVAIFTPLVIAGLLVLRGSRPERPQQRGHTR